MAKKKKGRRRGATARANNDLATHIASLGLATMGEYKTWCKQHGLSGATNKAWQERRQERERAQQEVGAAEAQKELQKHVEGLGLKTLEEYRTWCRQHNLSESVHKSAQQRRKEVEFCVRLRSEAALTAVKRQTRRPRDTIAAIFAGQVGEEELRSDYLRTISRAAAAVQGEEREALKQLLQCAERYEDFFSTQPALPRLGQAAGNTFIDGLAALARHCADWVRPLRIWRPDSHNARRRFASLARHLLAEYEVPAFMDTAWFKGEKIEAAQQQEWFKHIGRGQNIRTAAVPVQLSKKMAHHFLQAPADMDVEGALRWGQIVGQGGDDQLVRTVRSTQLGESLAHEEFWSAVILFLVNNPMLDPACVGPLVDYIHNQRYVPQEIVHPGGEVEHADPPQPDFTIKGRSALKLWRQRNLYRWVEQQELILNSFGD